MLVSKMVVGDLVNIEDKTIDQAITKCQTSFFIKLFEWFIIETPQEFSIRNYNIFNNKYSKNVTFNTENIVYECTITDLTNSNMSFKKFAERNSRDDSALIVDNKFNELKSEQINYTYHYGDPKKKINIDEIKYQNLIEFFEDNKFDFFGQGEFPFLSFKIIKIGQYQYYFYSITR